MSPWRSEVLPLNVGAAGADLAGAALASPPGDWPALAAELAARVAPRARLAVSVADCWARYFLLAPPQGVNSLADCRLLLAARFEALYGQAPADWVLQADWQAGRPMLACALPRGLIAALAACKLASVQPILPALWNRHCARLPDSGALCVSADGQANLLCWSGGQLRVVRQQKGADADALLALELARLDHALPSTRWWSGAAAPAGWMALGAAA